jgi:hypothetical protein
MHILIRDYPLGGIILVLLYFSLPLLRLLMSRVVEQNQMR